jgi:hypothetical protein
MTTTTKWCAAALAGLTVLALTAAGCGNGGIRGFDPEDTDYFISAQVVTGGTGVAATDIRCLEVGGQPFLSWQVEVDFLATGGAGGAPPTSPLTRFQLSHYTVTYRNATVPGGPVPAPFSQPLPFSTDVPGDIQLTGWNIMSTAQKTQWPLNDPVNLPNGGVTYVATVTTFGAPVTDTRNPISASFDVSLQVIDTCWDPDPVFGCPPSLLDPLDPSSTCD